MYARRLRLAWTLAISLACGASPSVPRDEACATLGQLYCEELPIDCQTSRDAWMLAGLPASACRDALAALPAAFVRLGPDLRGTALVTAMRAMLDAAPQGDPEALAALAPTQLRDAEFVCPGVASLHGAAPPDGHERWCATPDGTRHGPAWTWTDALEPSRETLWRHGVILGVHYMPRGPRSLPRALFVCPEGAALERSRDGDVDVLACRGDDGAVGSTVRWRGDDLVDLVDHQAQRARLRMQELASPP